MRVLHAPANVGNQPWVLSRYERALGVHSELIVNYSTWLGYPADKVLGTYGTPDAASVLKRAYHGLRAPFSYDVLHYYFARTLMDWSDWGRFGGVPFLDARLAKRFGRKVFFTLQGCDARLAGESNKRNDHTMCRPDGCSAYAACVATIDTARRRAIATLSSLADRIFYLNPELGHYVSKGQFLPYANVDLRAILPAPTSVRERPLLLHAPSDPTIKGTALIEAALSELREQFEFDYVAVKGVPHAEAMALYQQADLVIDQVLAGWYGGFAVEVMAMGKPVAAYLRKEDLKFLPPAMLSDLPVLNVRPDRLAEDIASILRRRAQWPLIGDASRRYVMNWHNPERIARAMVNAYRDPESHFDLASVPSQNPA